MTGFEAADSKSPVRLAKHGTVTSEIEAQTPEDTAEKIQLVWRNVGQIFSDLRYGANISAALSLKENSEVISVGVALHGQGFVIQEELARKWLDQDSNLSEVVKPTLNGRDLTDKPRNQFVIDFFGMSLNEAAKFAIPYQWVLERVLPARQTNNRKSYREYWWYFGEARPQLRAALNGLSRYIATPLTAKHRFFTFLSEHIIPDQSLVAM